jgi:hypothetical protein
MGVLRILRQGGPLLARVIVAAVALGAIWWSISTAPRFWSEMVIVEIAPHVVAGETYKSEVLDSLVAPENQPLHFRPSTLSKVAIIRLRMAEEAIASGAVDTIDSKLDQLRETISDSLANSPMDPFLWLVLYWVDNTRYGYAPERLDDLRMSYTLGPNEAWIATRRSRFALAVYSVLPADLAESAIAEFVGLVRSGLDSEAADIIVGPGWPIRQVLLARLDTLREPIRRKFAQVLDRREITGVPGIVPPAMRPWR